MHLRISCNPVHCCVVDRSGRGSSAQGSSDRASGIIPSNVSSNTAQQVHGRVSAAVKEMQAALQAELHEEQLQLFRRLGEGGFGTVYHGMHSLLPFCIPTLECISLLIPGPNVMS